MIMSQLAAYDDVNPVIGDRYDEMEDDQEEIPSGPGLVNPLLMRRMSQASQGLYACPSPVLHFKFNFLELSYIKDTLGPTNIGGLLLYSTEIFWHQFFHILKKSSLANIKTVNILGVPYT